MMSARLSLAVLLATAALPAFAQDVSYELHNASSLTVMEFYTSPVDEGSWGDDLLRAGVLPPGEAGIVTIADGEATCDYDLRFVMEDGQEMIETVDICELASFTLED